MARPRAIPNAIDTAERIMDVAERLVQTCGFNGFSYADIASELDLTKASLHYHFESKAALGEALLTRYIAAFQAALAAIDEGSDDPPRRLREYIDLYRQVVRGNRMCLCGMLAAEYMTLTPAMQAAIAKFFADNEAWLVRLLDAGRRDRTLSLAGPAKGAARLIIGSLEGAMLLARSCQDSAQFESVAGLLLSTMARPNRRPAPRGRGSG